jgi:hypothetical protein
MYLCVYIYAYISIYIHHLDRPHPVNMYLRVCIYAYIFITLIVHTLYVYILMCVYIMYIYIHTDFLDSSALFLWQDSHMHACMHAHTYF